MRTISEAIKGQEARLWKVEDKRRRRIGTLSLDLENRENVWTTSDQTDQILKTAKALEKLDVETDSLVEALGILRTIEGSQS